MKQDRCSDSGREVVAAYDDGSSVLHDDVEVLACDGDELFRGRQSVQTEYVRGFDEACCVLW